MFSSNNKLKFLSDENFPIAISELLSQEGQDVKQSPLGITDKQLSKLSKSDSRIILTFDKHFLNKREFPPEEHFGIVVFKITSPLIETISMLLSRLLKQVKDSEFKGRLFIISPFRFLSYPDNLFK